MSNKVASIKKARERQQAKDGQISVTLAQLIGSAMQTKENPAPSLQRLLADNAIPIRQSYLLGKITRSVFEEIKAYQSSHTALCEKHAERDSDGKARILDDEGKPVADGQPGMYDISADKMESFNKELAELLTTEVVIPGQQIKVSELQGVKIAPAHMMTLEWLIGD